MNIETYSIRLPLMMWSPATETNSINCSILELSVHMYAELCCSLCSTNVFIIFLHCLSGFCDFEEVAYFSRGIGIL